MEAIFAPTDILLPRSRFPQWSVIACDQFTSQPEYWAQAEALAGDAPSTLRLILPEAWLDTERACGAQARIAATMQTYLSGDVLEEIPNSYIYVERTQPDGRVRRGLVGALDLEQYDHAPRSAAPVRATEATVPARLPPRVAVRRAAALELPHVLLLMDDRDDRVLGPLAAGCRGKKLYDFDLMLGGGHITGRRVHGAAAETVAAALMSLGSPALLAEKYGDLATPPLLFAAGDGNHSLAAAKALWEEKKQTLTPEQRRRDPARWALAELVDLHDPALDFAPIHRVLLDTDTAAFAREYEAYLRDTAGLTTVGARVAAADAFCADYTARHGGRVDYIHGDDTARALGQRPGCAAVLLPPLEKSSLFPSVLRDGALPKKSFSMGQARDKRYYLECRRLAFSENA